MIIVQSKFLLLALAIVSLILFPVFIVDVDANHDKGKGKSQDKGKGKSQDKGKKPKKSSVSSSSPSSSSNRGDVYPPDVFGLRVNDISRDAKLPYKNNMTTQSIRIGERVIVSLECSVDTVHISLIIDDGWIIWDSNFKKIEKFSSWNVPIENLSVTSIKKDGIMLVDFEFIFTEPIGEQTIKTQVWDEVRNSKHNEFYKIITVDDPAQQNDTTVNNK